MFMAKHDKFPQLLRVRVIESAANTFTQTEQPTPTTSIGNGKALVMEILRVIFSLEPGDGATGSVAGIHLSEASKTVWIGPGDNDHIASRRVAIIITTSGLLADERIKPYELNDGGGNGLLVASKSLWLGIIGGSQAAALTGGCDILYRMKEVDAAELVGILQQ